MRGKKLVRFREVARERERERERERGGGGGVERVLERRAHTHTHTDTDTHRHTHFCELHGGAAEVLLQLNCSDLGPCCSAAKTDAKVLVKEHTDT